MFFLASLQLMYQERGILAYVGAPQSSAVLSWRSFVARWEEQTDLTDKTARCWIARCS